MWGWLIIIALLGLGIYIYMKNHKVIDEPVDQDNLEHYTDSQLFLNYPHMEKDWYPFSNYSIYDADANFLGYPYYDKAY